MFYVYFRDMCSRYDDFPYPGCGLLFINNPKPRLARESLWRIWYIVANWCHMATQMSVNTGLFNGMLPNCNKTLPEPMLTYHQRYPLELVTVKYLFLSCVLFCSIIVLSCFVWCFFVVRVLTYKRWMKVKLLFVHIKLFRHTWAQLFLTLSRFFFIWT